MEDFQLDLIIGEGPAARSVKIDLAKFTLIKATTRAGLLTNPLRDRFGIPIRLNFYSEAELELIVDRGTTPAAQACRKRRRRTESDISLYYFRISAGWRASDEGAPAAISCPGAFCPALLPFSPSPATLARTLRGWPRLPPSAARPGPGCCKVPDCRDRNGWRP